MGWWAVVLGFALGFGVAAMGLARPKHLAWAFWALSAGLVVVSTVRTLGGQQSTLSADAWAFRVEIASLCAGAGALAAARVRRRSRSHESTQAKPRDDASATTAQRTPPLRGPATDPAGDSTPARGARGKAPGGTRAQNGKPLVGSPEQQRAEPEVSSSASVRALVWTYRGAAIVMGAAVLSPDLLGPLGEPASDFAAEYGLLVSVAVLGIMLVPVAAAALYSHVINAQRRRRLARRGRRVTGRVSALNPTGLAGVGRSLLRPSPSWPPVDVDVTYSGEAKGEPSYTLTFDAYGETYKRGDRVELWVDPTHPQKATTVRPRRSGGATWRFVLENVFIALVLVMFVSYAIIAVLDYWILPAERAQAEATRPELRANVEAYSDAFLTGDVDGVVALLSEECRASLDRSALAHDVERDARLYEEARPFATFDAQIFAGSPYTASVSYTYPEVEFPDWQPNEVDHQSWRREAGVWKMDDAATCFFWEAR